MAILDNWNATLGNDEPKMTLDVFWDATLGDAQNECNRYIAEHLNVKIELRYMSIHEHDRDKSDNIVPKLQNGTEAFYCKFFWGYCIVPFSKRKESFFSFRDSGERVFNDVHFEPAFKDGRFTVSDPQRHRQLLPYRSLLKCRGDTRFDDITNHIRDELNFACSDVTNRIKKEVVFNPELHDIESRYFSLLLDSCKAFIKRQDFIEWMKNEGDLVSAYNDYIEYARRLEATNKASQICKLLTALIFGYIYLFNYNNALSEHDESISIEDDSGKKEKLKIKKEKLKNDIEKDRKELREELIDWLGKDIPTKKYDQRGIEEIANKAVQQNITYIIAAVLGALGENIPDKTKKEIKNVETIISKQIARNSSFDDSNDIEHGK